MQNGNELKGMIRQHIRITKGWNLVGSIIAMPLIISAPLINLFGDALTLTFMSRVKRWSERRFIASTHQIQAEELTSDKVLWHSKQTSDILDFFHIDAFHGLSNVQANDALQIYGKNQLVSKKHPHWIKTYLGQFKEFTTLVLVATALLSAFTGHLFDGVIMGSILLINAGIGTFQERKADHAVETMSQFVPPNCRVIRNGELKEIAAYDLVPGDIVELEAGDRIPADLRVIQSWSLEVNESSLTGESLPVQKYDTELNENRSPYRSNEHALYGDTCYERKM